jgi:hypothetical protein
MLPLGWVYAARVVSNLDEAATQLLLSSLLSLLRQSKDVYYICATTRRGDIERRRRLSPDCMSCQQMSIVLICSRARAVTGILFHGRGNLPAQQLKLMTSFLCPQPLPPHDNERIYLHSCQKAICIINKAV